MIIYNVTINIDNSVAEEWLDWMKSTHIPEVMATGYFLSNQIARLLHEEDNGGTTYAVQYTCRNLEDLEEYQRDHAPALQAKVLERYPEKFVAFRSLLQIVGQNVEKDQ
ncbi:DUF4286 family protein [Pontibacter ramchanderi]|uniref:Uncharacterized protein DUF4286 n=1 Tax=Pontibacter ramchanderi TaxID=1179743 RepID=A0A2N3UDG9_9BACT|nr:DUF4286 family protein [Pontibacter ramchanderi]PKV67382.1 uncharacterized protein DUF4286 [Pontibacter ramchanderi]